MSGKVLLDTNILLYALEPDTERSRTADAIVAQGGVISVQVVNECAAVLRRKPKWDWADVNAALAGFKAVCSGPRSLTAATHDAALIIAEGDGLNIYDALIVASALEAGCTTLLTEDMQHGRVIDGRLTIHNPFATV